MIWLTIVLIMISIAILVIVGLIYKKKNKGCQKEKYETDKVNKKGVVCFFGVIPRSIKYTYKSIKKNILDTLSKTFDIDIYIFNLNIENTLIDGEKLDQNDINIIPYTFKEEYKQSTLDYHLDKLCKEIDCKFINYYCANATRNAIRQMYSEYRVGLFLEKNKHKYNFAVICGPDYFIANEINLKDINDSIINNYVYTSQVNDAYGYTNGFYFGKLNLLIPLLKRYENIKNYLPANKDYEFFVKKALQDNNIERKKTDIVFFKIRANKHVWWQGSDRSYIKNINNINSIYKKVNLLKELDGII